MAAPMVTVFKGKQYRLVKEVREKDAADDLASSLRAEGSVAVVKPEGSKWAVYRRNRPNRGRHRKTAKTGVS